MKELEAKIKLAIEVHNVMVEHYENVKSYLTAQQAEEYRNAIDKTHSLVEALKGLRV